MKRPSRETTAPAGVVEVVGGRQLDAAAAVAVVHPELDRRDAGALAVLLARDEVVAVGRPGGGADVDILLLGQSARVACRRRPSSQTFSMPLRSLVNAIVLPSGEKRGLRVVRGPARQRLRGARRRSAASRCRPADRRRSSGRRARRPPRSTSPRATSKAIRRASARGLLMSAATSFFVGDAAGVALGLGVGVPVGVGVGVAESAGATARKARVRRIERKGTSFERPILRHRRAPSNRIVASGDRRGTVR